MTNMKHGWLILPILIIFIASACAQPQAETPSPPSIPDVNLPKGTPTLPPTENAKLPTEEAPPATIPNAEQTALSMRFGLRDYFAQQLWQSALQTPLSVVVAHNGAIYVREVDGVVKLVDPVSGTVKRGTNFDAAARQVMRGFSSSNGMDHVISPDGVEYLADWSEGAIMRIEGDGTRKPVVTGLSVNDPIYLDFGPDGMLYFTDRKYTFASVSPNGGPIKSYDFLRDIQSESLSLKDFAFEPSGDVVFVNHTSSNIIRASLTDEKLEVVVAGTLNSPALAISPNDEIFVGQTAEYPIKPSCIVRLEADGTTRVVAEVPGQLRAIAFAPDGTLYGTSHKYYPERKYDEFWLYQVLDDGTIKMIINRSKSPQVYQLRTLSVDPVSDDFVGFDFKSKRVLRISPDGKRESLLPQTGTYPIWSGLVAVDSDGVIWQLVIAEEGQLRGPSVNRELYCLLPSGEAKLIAKLPYLRGCCTMEAMAIGPDNIACVILSPEFKLVRVHLDGKVETLASDLPCDPLGIAVDRTGGIVFTSADGIFLLQPKH